MILALDPSSSRTGYALLQSVDVLMEAGLLKPRKATDPARDRITTMGEDLAQLLDDVKPELTVIEVTSGKVGKRHQGHGAGLAVYGMAVGFLWAVALRYGPVVCVEENRWTHGVPKEQRTRFIAAQFKKYNAASDAGGDAADAIGLGAWFLRQRRLQGVT